MTRLSRTARRPGRRTARPHASRAACAAVVAAAAAGSLLTGCGADGSGTTLTLYSGQHEQTTNALVSAFEKQTGITVNVTSNDEDILADEVATQGSSSPADLMFTENTPALEYLQGKHLLARVDSSTLAHTPSKYNSAQGDWAGVSARVSVLIYNPRLISKSKLPTSVLQLASPQYKGKLAIAAGETDFQPIVTSVLHRYGHVAAVRWLQGIKANASAGGHVFSDNETITNQVNQGAAAFGVINQYYWYRMRDEIGASNVHSQIAYFAARDPGYVIDVSPAAILRSSKHQAAAQKFLAFLVSKAGQEIIANPRESQSFEYPIASGVTTMTPETPFSQLKPYPMSPSELGDGTAAISLLRQAGLL
jgi:iron(III) transport system substrate-binding protein